MTLFRKLTDNAIIPQYQTSGSAGMDLHSTEYQCIPSGEVAVIGTGLAINLEELSSAYMVNLEAQIRSRSGLAAKYGVHVLNSPGTIDTDYRGELKVILHNTSKEDFFVSEGDRIAQLVISQYWKANELETKNNIREDKGFGSTGL